MTKIPDKISLFPERHTMECENGLLGGEVNSFALFAENKRRVYVIIQAQSFIPCHGESKQRVKNTHKYT